MPSFNGNGKRIGRPPVMDLSAEKQVYAILIVGGSLTDAADVLGIDRSTLNRHKADNPRFAKGVDRAAANGKLRLVKKVGKSRPWQAAAWMLERKWGSEYGKKDSVQHEHGGTVEVAHTFDHARYAELFNERRVRAVDARITDANGRAKPVHSEVA